MGVGSRGGEGGKERYHVMRRNDGQDGSLLLTTLNSPLAPSMRLSIPCSRKILFDDCAIRVLFPEGK